MKNKMSAEKKIKLFYSGELLFIGLVVLVFGILKMTNVMQTKETRLLVYNIITTIGVAWIFVDLIWSLVSAKRRAKSCFLDKFLMLPAALYILFFDICCYGKIFIYTDAIVRFSVGGILLYLAAIEIFMAIYHWFKPVPQILEAIEEEKKAEQEVISKDEEEIIDQNVEENNEQK